jgi:hypothetical protein
MQTDVNNSEAAPALRSRRQFFLSSGRVALTAPAVVLLLQATAKRAHAQSYSQIALDVNEGPVFGGDDAAFDDIGYVEQDNTDAPV